MIQKYNLTTMKTTETQDKAALLIWLFTSLISADYEGLTEDEKQDIIRRYEERKDYVYALEGVKDEENRLRLINLFRG